MAITDLAAYQSLLAAPWQRQRFSKNALTTVAGRAYSSWLQGGSPAAGSAPTTAAAPTSATTGALNAGVFNSSGTLRLLQSIFDPAQATTIGGGMVTICDRLSHQGGLSGTVTTAQTTNLPTAALTRYTGGTGVGAAFEIYTQIGTTGTTATISYTNQAGTTGRTSFAQTFGATGNREASRFIMVPLAGGDTGVRAVASATVLATTGTAGAFGVTLYYPLVSIPIDHLLGLRIEADALYGFGTWFPEILDDACLMAVYHMASTTTGVLHGELRLAEDA